MLNKLNIIYNDIYELFINAKIENFEKNPAEFSERGEFAKLFRNFNNVLEAAKIQGFKWSNLEYEFKEPKPKRLVRVNLDERIYLILVQRYKELSTGDGNGGGYDGVPFEVESYITEIDTGKIDADYMNSRFDKYCKTLYTGNESEIEATLNELHKSFASITQEEQKFANLFIHDVQNGDVQIDITKTFKDYIIEYQTREKDEQIHFIVSTFGLDEIQLRKLMSLNINAQNINDFGRFDDLKYSVDRIKAKAYFEGLAGVTLAVFKVNIKIDEYLRNLLMNN